MVQATYLAQKVPFERQTASQKTGKFSSSYFNFERKNKKKT
jgi:hypothetical protein